MNPDLNALTAFVTAIDPAAAGIVAIAVFVIQHLAAKQGANVTLGGLLGLGQTLLAKFFPALGNPTAPPALVPTTPADPAGPDPLAGLPVILGGKNDLLANRPVLKGLRDLLTPLLLDGVSKALIGAGDDHEKALAVVGKVIGAVKAATPAPEVPNFNALEILSAGIVVPKADLK